MTVEDILNALKNEGVELSAKDGALHLRMTRGPLLEKQRALLKENKAAILERLSAQSIASKESDGNAESVYKEYVYPDGTRLQLTRAEFESVADVFRMLLDHETKLILDGRLFKRS